MHANSLVQCLAVAPARHGSHEQVFRGHERKMFGDMTGDHRRLNDQAANDVYVEVQDRVGCEKGLRQDQPANRAVVQGSLQPLGGRRLAGRGRQGQDEPGKRAKRSARMGFRL